MGIEQNNETSKISKIFVLITCVDGQVDHTISQIKKINHVKQIHRTDGPYDILVTLESDSNEDLKNVLTHHIRTISTVGYTLTLRSSYDDEVLG